MDSAPLPAKKRQRHVDDDMNDAANDADADADAVADAAKPEPHVLALVELVAKTLRNQLYQPCTNVIMYDGVRKRGRPRKVPEGSDSGSAGGACAGPVHAIPVRMHGTRFASPIPGCDKTFGSFSGIRYHFRSHVHDIEALLLGAYPVPEGQKPSAKDVEGGFAPVDTLRRLDSSVRSTLTAVPPEAFPIVVPGMRFEVSSSGTKKLFVFDLLFGYQRSRISACISSRAARPGDADGAGGGSGGGAADRGGHGPDPGRPRPRGRPPSDAPGPHPTVYSRYRETRGDNLAPLPTASMLADAARDAADLASSNAVRGMPRELAEWAAREAVEGWRTMAIEESRQFLSDHDSCSAHIAFSGVDAGADPLFATLPPLAALSGGRGAAQVGNTGSAVFALDWCPYPSGQDSPTDEFLAVGGARGVEATLWPVGRREEGTEALRNTIQVWRCGRDASGRPRDFALALCICHEHGTVRDLRWCPRRPGDGPVALLGVLAAAFGDGTVRIFAVPQPTAEECIHLAPSASQLSLNVPGKLLWRLDWGGAALLAAGSQTGELGVWSTAALAAGAADPIALFPAHDSFVASVRFPCAETVAALHLRLVEPADALGRGAPLLLASSGQDGSVVLWDLRDVGVGAVLFRARGAVRALKFVPQWDAVFAADAAGAVRICSPTALEAGRARRGPTPSGAADGDDESARQLPTATVSAGDGQCWALDTSRFMAFVASASEDGSVRVANMNRLFSRQQRLSVETLYQLERACGGADSGSSRRFCFREPEARSERAGAAAAATAQGKASRAHVAIFPPAVSVRNVCWSRGAHSASWLASGMAAGLVRVEATV